MWIYSILDIISILWIFKLSAESSFLKNDLSYLQFWQILGASFYIPAVFDGFVSILNLENFALRCKLRGGQIVLNLSNELKIRTYACANGTHSKLPRLLNNKDGISAQSG